MNELSKSMSVIIPVDSKDKADYIREYVKQFSGEVQILEERQVASNMFEVTVFVSDPCDLYFIGKHIGQNFPINTVYLNPDDNV